MAFVAPKCVWWPGPTARTRWGTYSAPPGRPPIAGFAGWGKRWIRIARERDREKGRWGEGKGSDTEKEGCDPLDNSPMLAGLLPVGPKGGNGGRWVGRWGLWAGGLFTYIIVIGCEPLKRN